VIQIVRGEGFAVNVNDVHMLKFRAFAARRSIRVRFLRLVDDILRTGIVLGTKVRLNCPSALEMVG